MIILALSPRFIVKIKWIDLCKAVKTVPGTLEVLYKSLLIIIIIIFIIGFSIKKHMQNIQLTPGMINKYWLSLDSSWCLSKVIYIKVLGILRSQKKGGDFGGRAMRRGTDRGDIMGEEEGIQILWFCLRY